VLFSKRSVQQYKNWWERFSVRSVQRSYKQDKSRIQLVLARSQCVSGRSYDRPSRHRFSWFSSVIQANAEMVPKFQVATACFSCNPPDLNSSKLHSLAVKFTKIIYVNTNFEIKAPRSLSQATVSNHHNVFTFTLLLSEGRAGEAWEPSHNRCSFSLLPRTFSFSPTLLLFSFYLSLSLSHTIGSVFTLMQLGQRRIKINSSHMRYLYQKEARPLPGTFKTGNIFPYSSLQMSYLSLPPPTFFLILSLG
jgi:hypothetical protein